MSSLGDNNKIKFNKISKKKEGIYAHFTAKGIKGGTAFSSTIVVDLTAAEVDLGDSLEKIIEECARIAERDIKKSELQFEGLHNV